MRRVKVLKLFFIFMLLISFLVISNLDSIILYGSATIIFSSAVATILAIGIIVIVQSAMKLTMLAGTFGMLSYKKGAELEFYLHGIGKLMPATIANMFEKRAKKGVLYFTNDEAKDVTAWLEAQFHNTKGYVGFFVGTSLMIGLFGTFVGLLEAIDHMGGIILSMGGDVNISEIMAQFAGPLEGMAIGFAASLFGVSSAIILNFLQYILSRQQAAFIEDVEDWLKGKLIESQSADILGKINTTNETIKGHGAVDTSQLGMGSKAFLDVFVDKISELSNSINKANQSSELFFKQVAFGLEASSNATKQQVALFEDISKKLQELNTSQYSSTESMIEAIDSVSGAILSEHSTLKKVLTTQEQTTNSLLSLIDIYKREKK